MQDLINNIESRCEAPETDTSYEGAHLSAEYDADYDCTEISGQTYPVKDALRGLDGARWTGSAWVVDGNMVAAVRNADAHWAGGRTTLARRIAYALRNVPSDDCYFLSLGQQGCTAGECTAADTCAALGPAAVEDAEPARKISLRPVVAVAAKGAAHAVRSARARKAWETRRKNAARQAEILNATCEPLVTTSDALPASVSYSATPSAECCHGRTAHGTAGHVVTMALDAAGTGSEQPRKPEHHYRYSTAREIEIEDAWLRNACEFVDFRRNGRRMEETCTPPSEGRAARRRDRRNARRRELYRQRRAAA